MEALLGVAGLLGFLCCLIFVFIFTKTKQPRKKAVIGMVICFFVLIGSFSSASDDESGSKPSGGLAEPSTMSTSSTIAPTTKPATEPKATEPTTKPATEPKATEATTKPNDLPTTQPTEAHTHTYTLNTSTKVFHDQSCAWAKKISESNKSTYTGTREELIGKGYSPCGKCHP